MTFAYMLAAHYEDKFETEHEDHAHETVGCDEQLKQAGTKNIEEMDDICDDYFALDKYLGDLQTLSKITMAANEGEATALPAEISAALENGDLRNQLGETSNMNATMSANQYKMQKKEMSNRMNSLAFKMEKVYNLDKRKATAGVVKFFKTTFEDCLE